jgi:thioredoxin reductase (NADPH)
MANECAIIGGGPAGTACAIQLKRHGIDPILFEKNEIGGLLRNANLVENYPGFPEGIRGPELTNLIKLHLTNAGIHPISERVEECEWNQNTFKIKTDKDEYSTNVLVIASGTMPIKEFGCAIPEEAYEKIVYDIYPIIQVTGRKIVIVGAGDAAFDYALNLSQKNDVIILNRNNQTKCLPILWERVQKIKQIHYHPETKIQQILVEDGKLVLSLFLKGHHELSREKADFLIPAVGREPCLDFIGKGLNKYMRELQDANRLYLIGDVKNGLFRQTAISCGDGIRAAMQINQKIIKEQSG